MTQEKQEQERVSRQERRAGERQQAKEQANVNKLIGIYNRAARLQAIKARKQTFNTMENIEFTRER